MSLTKASYSMITGAPVNVLDYGADPTGATDSASAIQAAINASGAANLYFPKGTYLVASTLTFTSQVNKSVDFGGSTFSWRGSSSASVFSINDCQQCIFSNGRIATSASYPAVSAISLINGSGSTVAPSKNVFNLIQIEGTSLNALTYGVFISAGGGGGDANNDFHQFNDCTVYNYTNSGFYSDGTQMYGIMAINCSFTAASSATASCSFTHNANGGSLYVYGGGSANNTYTDFLMTGPGRPTTIQGFISENCASFLRTTGSGAAISAITILNSTWENNTASTIYSDKKVINFTYQGQIIVDGCYFTSTDAAADFVLTAAGSAGYIQKAGQIRATAIQSSNVNPLKNSWDIDATTIIDRSNASLNPLLLNTATYGTGQFNGVNGGTITLYGAKTLIFESGSVTITDIQEFSGISGYLGQQVTLIFRTGVTVTNGTYLKLAGATNFVATADDTLTLVYNGSGTTAAAWVEVSRSVN